MTSSTTRCFTSWSCSRREHSELRTPDLADPARRRRSERRSSPRCATRRRCCRSTTSSRSTSCAASTGESAGCWACADEAATNELRYVAELKIDGLAVALRYERRPLRPGRDARRRHDRRGRHCQPAHDRVDPQARWPSRSTSRRAARSTCPRPEFARINAEREEAGLPLYANPRNSGAGSLRQIDPQVTASRRLAAWFYVLIEEGRPAHRPDSQAAALAPAGSCSGCRSSPTASRRSTSRAWSASSSAGTIRATSWRTRPTAW